MNPVKKAVAWDFGAMGLNVPSFPSWHVTPKVKTVGFHYVFVQHQAQQIPTGHGFSLCELE